MMVNKTHDYTEIKIFVFLNMLKPRYVDGNRIIPRKTKNELLTTINKEQIRKKLLQIETRQLLDYVIKPLLEEGLIVFNKDDETYSLTPRLQNRTSYSKLKTVDDDINHILIFLITLNKAIFYEWVAEKISDMDKQQYYKQQYESYRNYFRVTLETMLEKNYPHFVDVIHGLINYFKFEEEYLYKTSVKTTNI